MKHIFMIALLLFAPIYTLAQESNSEISDLALGLASEELLISLHNCLKEGEQDGKYESCKTAKNYYINLSREMKNRDLSTMDVGRKIRIEKRLAIIKSLQAE